MPHNTTMMAIVVAITYPINELEDFQRNRNGPEGRLDVGREMAQSIVPDGEKDFVVRKM
jgi:hypothetical protein